jgi:hypothetical protein
MKPQPLSFSGFVRETFFGPFFVHGPRLELRIYNPQQTVVGKVRILVSASGLHFVPSTEDAHLLGAIGRSYPIDLDGMLAMFGKLDYFVLDESTVALTIYDRKLRYAGQLQLIVDHNQIRFSVYSRNEDLTSFCNKYEVMMVGHEWHPQKEVKAPQPRATDSRPGWGLWAAEE